MSLFGRYEIVKRKEKMKKKYISFWTLYKLAQGPKVKFTKKSISASMLPKKLYMIVVIVVFVILNARTIIKTIRRVQRNG